MTDDLSIVDIRKRLNLGETSVVEVVSRLYDRIDAHEPKLSNMVSSHSRDVVLEKAAQLDRKKTKGALFGIPFTLKESYLTKDLPTTAGSKVLEGFMSPYNATVYQKLIDQDAILIGKTSMDAWGHGASSENTDYKVVLNPHDVTRSAGGSSGGAAAGVTAGLSMFAVGEDTGGSIRNPASWNGVTGLKVTYGRVSRYGCIAYASSFDTVGPIARSAADCALVLETMAGHDSKDATCATHEVEPYSDGLSQSLKGKTIGVIPSLLDSESLDPSVSIAMNDALKVFDDMGVRVKEVDFDLFKYGLALYYLIAPSETSSNLGRYDGVRFGLDRSYFSQESMRRILIGTFALSAGYYDAYYRQAQKVRTLLIDAYKKTLDECDVLLMPVTPTPAPKIGDLINDPMTNMLADYFTVTQNPAGVPSLAFPAKYTTSGLPMGLQLTGRLFSEGLLLNMVHQFQQMTEYHKVRPVMADN